MSNPSLKFDATQDVGVRCKVCGELFGRDQRFEVLCEQCWDNNPTLSLKLPQRSRPRTFSVLEQAKRIWSNNFTLRQSKHRSTPTSEPTKFV